MNYVWAIAKYTSIWIKMAIKTLNCWLNCGPVPAKRIYFLKTVWSTVCFWWIFKFKVAYLFPDIKMKTHDYYSFQRSALLYESVFFSLSKNGFVKNYGKHTFVYKYHKINEKKCFNFKSLSLTTWFGLSLVITGP